VTRSPKDRIDDIRAAIAAIAEFEQDGRDKPVVFDAVRMRLPEIGAAANGITVDLGPADAPRADMRERVLAEARPLSRAHRGPDPRHPDGDRDNPGVRTGARDKPVVLDAVPMRRLEIGAAANGIPVGLRDSEPGVPWGAIIGLRNWMAHRCFDTAHADMWSAVDHDLQPLLDALDRLEQHLNGQPSDPCGCLWSSATTEFRSDRSLGCIASPRNLTRVHG